MFELPALPFSESALEPNMSRDTLATHHGKHHAAYIKKTNELMQQAGWTDAALEDVVRRAAQEKNQKLFNNAAQAWNHAFFWQCLTPQQQDAPAELKQAIEAKWQSFDKFRDEFLSKGESHFASGWVWLCQGADADLALVDLHDAQTPIVDAGVTPILVCDVWEHAYYLDHKNVRRAYLETVFDKLMNWDFAARQLGAARGGSPGWRFPSHAREAASAPR